MKALAKPVEAVRRALFAEGPVGCVVAVSGGADSVALLRAVLEARPSCRPLVVVAHLNHQLRGTESDTDQEFVAGLYAQLAQLEPCLEFVSERIAVREQVQRGLGGRGQNLEANAREIRYRWLAEVAQAFSGRGVTIVVTGHTVGDQAETVLHRLLRGTGLSGLRGIHVRRTLAAGVVLLRPLLSVSRAELLDYLASLGQEYRTDSSNADLRYTRNRIRLELLPLLKQYNPAVERILSHLAEQADEMAEMESAAARVLLTEAELPRAGSVVVLDRERLRQANRPLVRLALRAIWYRESWPADEMTYVHWNRLAEFALGSPKMELGMALDLPGKISARLEPNKRRVLQLRRRSEPVAGDCDA